MKNMAWVAFVIVVVLAVGAASFRVATAPDRISERRNRARSVCLNSGGEWVRVNNTELCRKA